MDRAACLSYTVIVSITRRQMLSLAAAGGLFPMRAWAQRAFPGVAYREYARCLPDYLRDLAEAAYQTRNREIAKLTSSEAVRARQRWVRDTFWKLAGGEPERTPLEPQNVGSFERAGYRVEKIVYQSRPHFHVPANLYIPASGRPPFPAVLFQLGHSNNGKAYDSYQRCCQGLARLGYVVLAFDPMGQGERIYYPDKTGKLSRLGGADDEHTAPGKQMLLFGDTSTRLQVWDAVRSLDYLASLPIVDAKRIGGTGQSGGATLTMLLMAVDDRLAAAAVCSGNTENVACANFIPPGSTDDAEQDFIASAPLGFDRWDVMYPFAPKPLLISVSDKDFFGTYSPRYIASGWEEFQKLRSVYETLGHADRIAWTGTPLPHSLAYDSRLHVYNWFARWLRDGEKPVEMEPPVEPEPDEKLWVAESGNVVRSFGGLTPFAMNKTRFIEQRPADLAELLGASRPTGATATVLRRVPSREVFIEALEVGTAPKVWAPAWLFLSRKEDASKPIVLSLEDGGRNRSWHEGELYQVLAAKGYPVCVADVRGLGDLAPEFGTGSAGYMRAHQDEENYAWSSLMLGRPLAGQRVTDILALAAALRGYPSMRGRRVVIAARGKMTVPAIFAAALDREIAELYLAGGLVSFRNLVDTEDFNHSFANFVPGLLRHTDLPELVESLAPRRVTLAGTVNGAGVAMDTAAVRRIYSPAIKAGILNVRDQADWDLASLSSWSL